MSDLISRDAAFDEIIWNSDNGVIDAKVAIEALRKLPSVEQERPHGKWKWDQRTGEYVCSECGCNPIYERTTPDCSEIDKYKFCRWCGAKMMDEQTLKYADTDTAFGGLQSAT